MRIVAIDAKDAARLVPLNAIVQALHATMRPDVFYPPGDSGAVADYFAEWLTWPGVFALVAETGGRDIGYVLAEVQDVPDDPISVGRRRGLLHHIAVVDDWRRQGVGSALLAAARDRFLTAGATRWQASYWGFNVASAALMAKAGLRPTITVADAPLQAATDTRADPAVSSPSARSKRR